MALLFLLYPGKKILLGQATKLAIDYLPSGWQESDYWLLPYPELGTEDSLHTGGDSHYIAVSKIKGEVSTITIYGE